MQRYKNVIAEFGWARIIIFGFLLSLIALAFITKMPVGELVSSSLVRIGMNAVLVLAVLVGVQGGIKLNFGISIGIVCGLLGIIISMEMKLTGAPGFMVAMMLSIFFSILMGYAYGILLNNTKGDEMTVATYIGFAVVSLFSILWIVLPITNEDVVWPIGKGIRTTISLAGYYEKILDGFLSLSIGEIVIPTGTFLFIFICCLFLWLFFRSKAGTAMIVAGLNPQFALTSSINVDRYRILSTVISTMLAAVGILVYAQSFGFIQLYQAPLMMGFAAVASLLIGGASIDRATILNAVIGVFLFQSILTISMPVANRLIDGSLADITRVLVSNGIIIYALTKTGGEVE